MLEEVAGSSQAWAGEHEDGLGKFIPMLAYANPKDENQRVDGHGIVRFNQKDQAIKCECWPRLMRKMWLNFPAGM